MNHFRYLLREAQFRCFQVDQNISDSSYGCPKIWDGLMCWHSQATDTALVKACPSYVSDFTSSGLAAKKCDASGNWFRHPLSNWTWTNYTTCKSQVDTATPFIQFYLTVCGYTISIVFLVIALIIFTTFRSLKCQRVTIHKNLFVTYIVSAVTSIAWLISTQQTAGLSQFWCKGLNAIHQYTMLCNYYWMLCEGIYLHCYAVAAVFRARQNMFFFLILGWGVPLLPTLIYVLDRVFVDDLGCWTFVQNSFTHYIVHGPVLTVLLINTGILLNVLRVLSNKLRTSSASSRNDYRGLLLKMKAVRSTLILIPLLGVHHVLLSLVAFTDNPVASTVVDYVQVVLNSLQGFSVAVIFCFCHEEVVAKVRRWMNVHVFFEVRHRTRNSANIEMTVSKQGSMYVHTTQTEGISQVAEQASFVVGEDFSAMQL